MYMILSSECGFCVFVCFFFGTFIICCFVYKKKLLCKKNLNHIDRSEKEDTFFVHEHWIFVKNKNHNFGHLAHLQSLAQYSICQCFFCLCLFSTFNVFCLILFCLLCHEWSFVRFFFLVFAFENWARIDCKWNIF